MNHDEIQDLLEAYVDDRLDRPTRKMVDDHLRTCDECRSILDEVAPVDITVLGPARFDERAMRRTVRRSIFRVTANTALLLLAGLIVAWSLSAVLYQPLVVNRGGRAADAARASIDLVSMLNPGAVVTEGGIQSGFLDRVLTFEVVVPVGSSRRQLGPIKVRIGAFDIRSDQTGSFYLPGDDQVGGDAVERLGHLGEGTVATVRIDFPQRVSVETAQAIADSDSYDIRTVWAGFHAPRADGTPDMLGYGTCLGPEVLPDDVLGATSASFGRSVGSTPSSIIDALASVRAALANLIDNPGLSPSYAFGSPDDVRAAADQLATDPSVVSLVVTGPSTEIARYLAANAPEDITGTVLAVDFYNWTSGTCGR